MLISGSVANLRHFVTVRRFTYDVISQWFDLTWKWKKLIMSGLNGKLVMPNFSSLSQTAPEQSRENRMRGTPFGRRGLSLSGLSLNEWYEIEMFVKIYFLQFHICIVLLWPTFSYMTNFLILFGSLFYINLACHLVRDFMFEISAEIHSTHIPESENT